jgi:hypothetical protein
MLHATCSCTLHGACDQDVSRGSWRPLGLRPTCRTPQPCVTVPRAESGRRAAPEAGCWLPPPRPGRCARGVPCRRGAGGADAGADAGAWFQLWPEGGVAGAEGGRGAARLHMVTVDADARRDIYCQPLYSARSFQPPLGGGGPAATAAAAAAAAAADPHAAAGAGVEPADAAPRDAAAAGLNADAWGGPSRGSRRDDGSAGQGLGAAAGEQGAERAAAAGGALEQRARGREARSLTEAAESTDVATPLRQPRPSSAPAVRAALARHLRALRCCSGGGPNRVTCHAGAVTANTDIISWTGLLCCVFAKSAWRCGLWYLK